MVNDGGSGKAVVSAPRCADVGMIALEVPAGPDGVVVGQVLPLGVSAHDLLLRLRKMRSDTV